jgi:hypothetical protein
MLDQTGAKVVDEGDTDMQGGFVHLCNTWAERHQAIDNHAHEDKQHHFEYCSGQLRLRLIDGH